MLRKCEIWYNMALQSISTALTPEQIFIWRMLKQGGSVEAAIERAKLGIEEAQKIKNIDERDYEVEQWQQLIDKYAPKEVTVAESGDEETAQDIVDENNAEVNDAEGAAEENTVAEDNQGNPIDENGNLIIEEVASIADITDDDFDNPTRNVQLPPLPENVAIAIGTNGKPVVIKRNIFIKNADNHPEIGAAESREIIDRHYIILICMVRISPNALIIV